MTLPSTPCSRNSAADPSAPGLLFAHLGTGNIESVRTTNSRPSPAPCLSHPPLILHAPSDRPTTQNGHNARFESDSLALPASLPIRRLLGAQVLDPSSGLCQIVASVAPAAHPTSPLDPTRSRNYGHRAADSHWPKLIILGEKQRAMTMMAHGTSHADLDAP